MAFARQRVRFNIDEYSRMGEVGILGPEDRTELIDGEIVRMSPIGARHASVVDRLTQVLVRRIEGGAIVRVQNPLMLDECSLPHPDIVLLQYRDDVYADDQPGPDDALLVVEVAETSGRYDRRIKLPLYSRAGVPEVWIVVLGDKRVEVCRDPVGRQYGSSFNATPSDTLSPLAMPGLRVAVDEILGIQAEPRRDQKQLRGDPR